MDQQLTQLIEEALKGENDSKAQLAKAITPRIRTYIFRSTLDHNVTDDLLQEVFCIMLESLSSLKNINSFWPWIYRVASNCINSHYRASSKSVRSVNLQDGLLESIVADNDAVESDYMSEELGQAVMTAVSTLKPHQRQVVTLRCFEDMSFKQISEVEQTSEVYSRVLFHRAVEKLRVALKKQGFSTASMVLALTMFGRLTSPTKAAAIATTVEAGTVAGGGVAKTVAIVSAHQVKAAAAAAIIACVIMGTIAVGTLRSNVQSIHYVIQGVTPVVKNAGQNVNANGSSSSSESVSVSTPSALALGDMSNVEYKTKGAYENKLYLPEGPDGPVLRFMQRWNMGQTGKLCSWLQDGSGNYYYESWGKQIHITNDPLRMLVMPSDKPDFVKFIFSQAGYDSRVSYERKFLSSMVDCTVDNRVPEYADFTCEYTYNSLVHSDLSETWPDCDDVVDKRDEMHKRGWTCFEVSGQIKGKKVSGIGRIPFVYDMYQDHKPWLRLHVGDDVYTDYPGEAATAKTANGTVSYRDESFMQGLCRPWQGLACVDTVRRDAAKYRLRFQRVVEDSTAEVTVFVKTDSGPVKMVYDIDMDVDIIRSITFIKGINIIGKLNFDYIQDESIAASSKFDTPQPNATSAGGNKPKQHWLAALIANYL